MLSRLIDGPFIPMELVQCRDPIEKVSWHDTRARKRVAVRKSLPSVPSVPTCLHTGNARAYHDLSIWRKGCGREIANAFVRVVPSFDHGSLTS